MNDRMQGVRRAMTGDPQQQQAKEHLAEAALDWLQRRGCGKDGLGIGSGSTVACFIEALAGRKDLLRTLGAVAPASEVSAQLLRRHGIPLLDLPHVGGLEIYIDGADRIDPQLRTIKGGGAALAREKLLACAADFFLCLCDASKRVPYLRGHPLPMEVLPVAMEAVSGQIRNRWGRPEVREGIVTDNGNRIVDIHDIHLTEPLEALEQQLASLPGVLDCGLFARRRADLLLTTDAKGEQVEAVQANPNP